MFLNKLKLLMRKLFNMEPIPPAIDVKPLEEKTAEQLAKEAEQAKQIENVNRMRAKVKDVFYPFLAEKSKSIEDAKKICAISASGLEQLAMQVTRKKTLKDLDYKAFISAEAEMDVYRQMADLFTDETVGDALRMIQEMPRFFDETVRKENETRKLSDLTLEWLPPTAAK